MKEEYIRVGVLLDSELHVDGLKRRLVHETWFVLIVWGVVAQPEALWRVGGGQADVSAGG